MVKKKIIYSKLTGLWKWFKNLIIIGGLPGAAYLVNNYTEWVPQEYLAPAGIIVSAICYMWKNKIDFEKRN